MDDSKVFMFPEGANNGIDHNLWLALNNICKYYNIEEDSEDAAYLIGYIIQRMHRVFRNMISTGKR